GVPHFSEHARFFQRSAFYLWPPTLGAWIIALIEFHMKSFFPILLRVVLVFAIACVLQYLIPWYLLVAGGVVAGFFMLKTSNDRAAALGLLIGSIVFGIFAYIMAQIFPVAG
ncbi:MAG: hypothetical protein Q7T20_13290, partial [Saprospiraceae bacterium]|nr:hypothetical protein [Saprospiraceae bacterium]